MCVSASRAGCKRRWDARSRRKRACVFLYVRVCVCVRHIGRGRRGDKKKKGRKASFPPLPTSASTSLRQLRSHGVDTVAQWGRSATSHSPLFLLSSRFTPSHSFPFSPKKAPLCLGHTHTHAHTDTFLHLPPSLSPTQSDSLSAAPSFRRITRVG